MARLSGLPSEHHHEGPGDAPRRRRGRPAKGQTPAEDGASHSKRVLSPTAESSQTKRVRRVQVDDGESQIAEEVEESATRSQHGDTIHVENQTSTTTTRRNRRHSEPAVGVQDDDEDEDELAGNALAVMEPLSGLTPHLDRLGATRNRFTNTRRARMSMPAQLNVERVDDQQGNRFQFMPIKAVLNGRTRRSLRRNHVSEEMNAVEAKKQEHKKQLLALHRQLRDRDDTIKNLEFKLESRRLGNIDVTEYDQELEQQLELARKEIDDLRASSLYMGSDRDLAAFDGAADVSDDDDDHNRLELINSDDLHMSQDLDLVPTPHGQFASRVMELSNQVTFEHLPEISQLTHDTLVEDDEPVESDSIHDQAVHRYERELQGYTRALAEAQGALRVVTIELQNLNFVEPGAASDEILTELRHSLDFLRHHVEKYFPGICTGLTGAQMLRKIPELFGGIFYELHEKTVQIESSRKTEVLLRRQYEGVLDLLGEAEAKVEDKDAKIYHLDKSNDEKNRTILDLDEQVTTLTALAEGQDAGLKDQAAQILILEDQVVDKDANLEKLHQALDAYRQDLDTVTLAATQFEEDHHETIARMEQEHAQIVLELENELTAEQTSREAAEEDAQQRADYIDELEGRISRMESDVVTITTEMATLRERLEIETEGRAIAETERDTQITIVYQQANTIENLNETILELNDQIALLRANLKAEQTQREKTEVDLDEANNKIDDLNLRLHDLGIQGNELRSKLFQVQQEKEQAIAQLQDEAAEREEVLNEQLATETGLRENAEKVIVKLTKQITMLQTDLANLNVALADMTNDRDELMQDRDTQVAALAAELIDLRAKYAALQNSTSSTITTLEANITDLNHQIQRKDAEIKILAERVIEQERIYVEDTTLLKENVAVLQGDLAAERAENEDLRAENASLSERLAEAASEFLNVVSTTNDERKALESDIAAHKATILQHQAAAVQRAAEHEELLMERAREIEQLQLLGEEHVGTIIGLNTQIESLKDTFREQVERTNAHIDSLVENSRLLQEKNEQLGEDLKRQGVEALKGVQSLKAQGFETKTVGLSLHRPVTGRITKASDKVKIGKKVGSKKKVSRRQYDSGFGIDPDVEEATDGAEANGDEFIAA
ncbi:hypothetical protein P153DRAFT_335097 [Dothidotthia symphoricarpi CBS 119687]|uniref:Uncharacterized protein n=1 Tax=Dothidotthia symphoricarpi CBS 119687 TaxID=1392245 RepID=A0A6A6AKG4_9PLEO|nr:uncharacterized protein P153DRAFT_335097 [Dothidotthia symphoricarpi CBS 119687]KAF2132310.1 hypothetical protein P153DRAFT_335097 [Dothidotthia symphoricarpi CBS 119687]